MTMLQTLFATHPEVRFSVDTGKNAVVAIASAAQHETIAKWVKEIDGGAGEGGQAAKIEVYALKDRDPDAVLAMMTNLMARQLPRVDLSIERNSNQLVAVARPELVLWFGLMGSLLLSFLGLLTSVWAEKFDHAAAVTNFVVTPLSLLSGTFYSVHQLSPAWQTVSHLNPFFYVISGFRAGFLGVSDSPLLVGSVALLILNIALFALCYAVLKSGWKIKN